MLPPIVTSPLTSEVTWISTSSVNWIVIGSIKNNTAACASIVLPLSLIFRFQLFHLDSIVSACWKCKSAICVNVKISTCKCYSTVILGYRRISNSKITFGSTLLNLTLAPFSCGSWVCITFRVIFFACPCANIP